MWPHLERIVDDWSAGVDHGAAWPMKIVDLALTLRMFKSSVLERHYRDVRAGGFHPANRC
jgi:hypothetical protein